MRKFWGRVARVRIFEQTKNPNDRTLKREYFDDGDRKHYDIDFDIRGSLMEEIPSVGAVSVPVDTAQVEIFNLAETGEETGDKEINIGDMIEVSAGYRGLENEGVIFLGVIVKVKPVKDGTTRKTIIIANDGSRYWLGHPVVNKMYIRAWDAYDNSFVDGNPWTATQIARDVVENHAGLKFYAGQLLDPNTGAAPAQTGLINSTPELNLPDLSGGFELPTGLGGILDSDLSELGGILGDLGGAAGDLLGSVGKTAEGLLGNASDKIGDFIGNVSDLMGGDLGAAEDILSDIASVAGLAGDNPLPLSDSPLSIDISIGDLATEGKYYFHGAKINHTPFGALVKLTYESGFWAHKLHLGEVYWNPTSSLAVLNTGYTLNAETGLLNRVEYIEEGRIRNEPHAEKQSNVRHESPEHESFVDFFVPAVLTPQFGPGFVFRLQAEVFKFAQLLNDIQQSEFTQQEAPGQQVYLKERQQFDGHVQIKEYRHVKRSKANEFSTYMKVKAL